jgi:T1SS-143 domain-containing protein
VDANGNVSLDQLRALVHPDATNPNEAISLAAGSLVLTATSTDKDGDKAAANLNIGGALSFKDDAPRIVAGTVSGAVEEEALQAGNQDANDIPNTGLVAAGSLGGLAVFGADGAGSFSLDGSAIASLTSQSLKSNGVALTYSIAGDTLTAKAGAEDVFTLQLGTTGNYTFTLKSHLDHAPVQGENTLNISFGNLVKVTDRDGDSVNLGGTANFAIAVQDDIPAPCPVTIIGAVDEDGLSGANADAGRPGEFASNGLAVATGSLFNLASFGADGPAIDGGFSLDASALNTLTAQGLTQAGVDVVYSLSGNTLTANAGVGGPAVFTLTVNPSGNYTFTLLGPVQHSSAQGENSLTLDFTKLVKITDRDGDSISLGDPSHAGPIPAKFLITVQDDIPVAVDITKSTVVDVGAVTNLTLVLDVSGSMATLVTIGGQTISRLDAEKQSAKALIDEYAALGPVKITVVTFSDGANLCKYWLDASAAKATIDGIGTPAGNTNYTAALDAAKSAYDGGPAHTGMLANAQDVLYFVSDGVPNPLATGLDTPAEVTAWESFLRGSTSAGNAVGEKITAFALGIGPDVAVAQLNPIAFNGVTNTDTNAIIVTNFSDLTSTLLSTVLSQPVIGSLLTDPNPDAGFGADGGWVQIVNVDGKTYVYDQKADATTGSTGTNGTFNTVDNTWTIITANGGKIVVDMDDGAYIYTPPTNVSGSKVETVGFTLIDRDGDTASANLRINVEGPTLVVGQNVNDLPGQPTPHKVDPVSGTAGQIAGGGSNDILIGDIGGGSLQGKATNVILILDTSGSMTTAFGTNQPSRLDGLKAGVNDMIESLKTSGATDVRVHINHFATDVAAGAAGAQTFDLIINGVVQTANVTAAHGFVNGLTATGFTNYEAGLQEALTWVNGPNELTGANVTNQVVFVSDGQPNTALTGNGATATAAGSLTADQAIQHILGTGSGDSVSEVAQLESNFGPINAIGMGLTAADLAVLSQVEGAGGAARNTTNASEFKIELANVNPTTSLGAVGNDVISGGAGNDIIFGDSVNTDALAAARGLSLPPGSGWKVFETLEAGAGWTRADTEGYIRSHQSELAAESTATGGAKRAGGNDTIDAGAGNDTVYGQEGNDIIIGGAGNDILSGGSGADTFKWASGNQGTGLTPALDTIKDFNPTTTDAANKDVLDLRDLLQGENAGNLSSYLSFSQTGADVTLSVHSAGATGPVDQKIVLQGVTMAQLAGGHTADSAGVIANLLANNKLVTD